MKYETHETTKQMAEKAAWTPFARALDLCCGTGWVADYLREFGPVLKADIEPYPGAIQSDLFENVEGAFDLIVSSGPCVPSGIVDEREDLRPRICYDGGPTGFELIQRVIDECPPFLSPGGTIWIEFDNGQAGMFPEGWTIEKDDWGNDRFAHWTKEL